MPIDNDLLQLSREKDEIFDDLEAWFAERSELNLGDLGVPANLLGLGEALDIFREIPFKFNEGWDDWPLGDPHAK